MDKIEKPLLEFTQSEITHLGHQFSPHPPGSVRIEGRGEFFFTSFNPLGVPYYILLCQ